MIRGTGILAALARSARKLVRTRAALRRLSPEDRALVKEIRARRLTYLSELRLATIASTIRSIASAGVPGIFLEAGCALGGSAALIARLKPPERPLRVFDVFEMIPAPDERDRSDAHERYGEIASGRSRGIDGGVYYGYVSDLFTVVLDNLRACGVDPVASHVQLVRGRVQDTLHIDQPVAFAHIDVDWYDPVRTCLERVFSNLSPGGVLIIDDYDGWEGCRLATDEFLRGVGGGFVTDDFAGSLKITRTDHHDAHRPGGHDPRTLKR